MQAETTHKSALDINEILDILPHRYPFVLVDRVIEHQPGERIVALKNVTINEPFFPGHFPSKPVMPGVLILEALAQATALLVFQMQSEEERRRSLFLFAGIDNVRFRRQVEPGDQLILEANLLKLRRGIGRLQCKATVDGEVVTEAELMGAIQTV